MNATRNLAAILATLTLSATALAGPPRQVKVMPGLFGRQPKQVKAMPGLANYLKKNNVGQPIKAVSPRVQSAAPKARPGRFLKVGSAPIRPDLPAPPQPRLQHPKRVQLMSRLKIPPAIEGRRDPGFGLRFEANRLPIPRPRPRPDESGRKLGQPWWGHHPDSHADSVGPAQSPPRHQGFTDRGKVEPMPNDSRTPNQERLSSHDTGRETIPATRDDWLQPGPPQTDDPWSRGDIPNDHEGGHGPPADCDRIPDLHQDPFGGPSSPPGDHPGLFDGSSNPFGDHSDRFGGLTGPFGDDSGHFGGRSNPFGDRSSPFGDSPNPFGDDSGPFGGLSNPFGDHSGPLGDDLGPFGGVSSPSGDHSGPFGDSSNPFGDHSGPFSGPSDPFGDQSGPFGGSGVFAPGKGPAGADHVGKGTNGPLSDWYYTEGGPRWVRLTDYHRGMAELEDMENNSQQDYGSGLLDEPRERSDQYPPSEEYHEREREMGEFIKAQEEFLLEKQRMEELQRQKEQDENGDDDDDDDKDGQNSCEGPEDIGGGRPHPSDIDPGSIRVPGELITDPAYPQGSGSGPWGGPPAGWYFTKDPGQASNPGPEGDAGGSKTVKGGVRFKGELITDPPEPEN